MTSSKRPDHSSLLRHCSTHGVVLLCCLAVISIGCSHSSPPQFCAEVDRSQMKALARAMTGDAIVLKYSDDFTEHASVAPHAAALGATRTEPFLAHQAVVVDALSAAQTAVLLGMPRGGAQRLSPWLQEGSLNLGDGDVLLSRQLAAHLLAEVGQTIHLGFVSRELQPRPRVGFHAVRVVGLLDHPAPPLVVAPLAWAERAARGTTEGHATGLSVWFEHAQGEQQIDALKAQIDGATYHVLSATEMNEARHVAMPHL